MPRTAVTLDAYGTLVHLDAPVARLTRLLAEAGHPNPESRVRTAFRAEVDYYREHIREGSDPVGLADLRRRCAAVFRAALDDPPPLARSMEVLLEGLCFATYADVGPTLDALVGQGQRLAVISNWDCSLRTVLERVGIADRFDVISDSASGGCAKPGAAIFLSTLGALGVAPRHALHCGDDPVADLRGPGAVGMQALLLARAADAPPGALTGLDQLIPHAARLGDG